MLNTTLQILNILGYISTIIVILSAILATILCFRGFVPVLIRLGNGLWKRKIAIFAKNDALISLDSLLRDSKLFKHTNILKKRLSKRPVRRIARRTKRNFGNGWGLHRHSGNSML